MRMNEYIGMNDNNERHGGMAEQVEIWKNERRCGKEEMEISDGRKAWALPSRQVPKLGSCNGGNPRLHRPVLKEGTH